MINDIWNSKAIFIIAFIIFLYNSITINYVSIVYVSDNKDSNLRFNLIYNRESYKKNKCNNNDVINRKK